MVIIKEQGWFGFGRVKHEINMGVLLWVLAHIWLNVYYVWLSNAIHSIVMYSTA